jgi:hypothetical protein
LWVYRDSAISLFSFACRSCTVTEHDSRAPAVVDCRQMTSRAIQFQKV